MKGILRTRADLPLRLDVAAPGTNDLTGVRNTGNAPVRKDGSPWVLVVALAILNLLATPAESAAARPNVLFIAIDDLRPLLGCYGDAKVVTPNIDRLAERGTVFQRAYCQQAVCSPSRMSLMTGRRPDTTQVWDLATHFRKVLPGVITLPQYFKVHGYHTRSIGKIYHGGGAQAKDPPSWSEAPLYDIARDAKVRYATPENLKGKGLKRSATEAADVPDGAYIDGMVCDAALDALTDLKKNGKPFFLAVGFASDQLYFIDERCRGQHWDMQAM